MTTSGLVPYDFKDLPDPDSFMTAEKMKEADRIIGKYVDDYAIRSIDHPLSPNNTKKVFYSDTNDDRAAVLVELDAQLTTPDLAQIFTSRTVDTDTGAPNRYEWINFIRGENKGNASMTGFAARMYGFRLFPISSSGRVYGMSPQHHGFESTVGAHNSVATVTKNGSDTVNTIIPSGSGMRFESGMVVTLSGALSVPGGTTILAVTGRPGAPSQIQLSNPITGAGSGTLTATPGGAPDVIAYLATVNGAIAGQSAFQAQGQSGQTFDVGLLFGASAFGATSKGIKFSSTTLDRILSVESATITDGVVVANTAVADSLFEVSSGTTLASIIKIAASVQPTGAALVLPSQRISTDSAGGLMIVTSATHKLGFFGSTPIVRPTLANVATDAATTQTLANSLRSALINLGLGA